MAGLSFVLIVSPITYNHSLLGSKLAYRPLGTTMVVANLPSFSTDADTFEDKTLNQDDVADVVCEILDVQTKSKTFGRVLKLPKATVDAIHCRYSETQDCLFHVIDEFVKQLEPRPTWRVILNALRNPLIDHSRLAQEIERKYSPTLQGIAIHIVSLQSLLVLQSLVESDYLCVQNLLI